MRKLSKATIRVLAVSQVKGPTRLHYATEDINGELGRLKSVSFSGPRYDMARSFSGYEIPHQRDAGELVFELEYDEQNQRVLVCLFNKTQQVEWTIEMPNGYTWGFKGFVSSVDVTANVGTVPGCCQVKVKVSGPVTLYSEAVHVADNTPVFTKAASKVQATTYARMLELITHPAQERTTFPPSGYVEGDYVEPVEYDEYEEYDDRLPDEGGPWYPPRKE